MSMDKMINNIILLISIFSINIMRSINIVLLLPNRYHKNPIAIITLYYLREVSVLPQIQIHPLKQLKTAALTHPIIRLQT